MSKGADYWAARAATAEKRHIRHYLKEVSTNPSILDQVLGDISAARSRALHYKMWPEADRLATVTDPYLDMRGHWSERIEMAQAGRDAARALANAYNEASHLITLSNAYYKLGKIEQAIAFAKKALIISRRINDRHFEGLALANLALARVLTGELKDALRNGKQYLAITAELGDRHQQGKAYGILGDVYYDLGELHEAVRCYKQALDNARESGAYRDQSAALMDLGQTYLDLDRVDRAKACYVEAADILEALGDKASLAATKGGLANVWQIRGEHEAAVEQYKEILKITEEIGDALGQSATLSNMGKAYFELKKAEEAIACHKQSLAIDRSIANRSGEAISLYQLGLIYAQLTQQPGKAIPYYKESIEIAQEINSQQVLGVALFNLCMALDDLNRREEAIAYAEDALTIFEKNGSPHQKLLRQHLWQWQKRGEKQMQFVFGVLLAGLGGYLFQDLLSVVFGFVLGWYVSGRASWMPQLLGVMGGRDRYSWLILALLIVTTVILAVVFKLVGDSLRLAQLLS